MLYVMFRHLVKDVRHFRTGRPSNLTLLTARQFAFWADDVLVVDTRDVQRAPGPGAFGHNLHRQSNEAFRD